MRVRGTAAIAVLALCIPAGAVAQQALPMTADALIYERDGAVIGCGIRVTGGKPEPRSASSWFDVSVNVFRRGVALAQALAYEIPKSSDGEGRAARVPIQSAWIKAGAGSAKLGENSERQDSLIYGLAFDEALALFDATGRGSPISVGIKRWGQRTATVQEGTATLNAESRQRIEGCVTRLAE